MIFLFQMTNLKSEIENGNFKVGCNICKWTSKRPAKNVTNDFCIKFRYAFVHAKNDSFTGMLESVASRILAEMAASVFHRILSNIKIFCRYIITNIWIYTTRRSRLKTSLVDVVICFRLLKTLFYFISQCPSVPYLESGLCKLDKELDNCNFTFI